MARHRFEAGQSIEVVAGNLTPREALGRYTVIRTLPNDGADREYRVRHDQDGHERVVRESQMKLGSSAALGKRKPLPPS